MPCPQMMLRMRLASQEMAMLWTTMRWKMVQLAMLQGQCEGQVLGSSSLNTNTLSTDPSVPPANGAQPLTALPVELLRLVTANLDPIAHHSIRLSRKVLRGHVDAPALMSHGEYVQFQKLFEAHSSRKAKNLYCSFCNTFKGSTPSKTTFTDAQAVQKYSGRRACIECGVANGHYDKRDVVIKKKKLFVCGGCKQLLTHEKEEKTVTDVVTTQGYPYRDNAWGQGAEITISSGGKRWCKLCRVAIAGLGDSGAIKVKQVHMP